MALKSLEISSSCERFSRLAKSAKSALCRSCFWLTAAIAARASLSIIFVLRPAASWNQRSWSTFAMVGLWWRVLASMRTIMSWSNGQRRSWSGTGCGMAPISVECFTSSRFLAPSPKGCLLKVTILYMTTPMEKVSPFGVQSPVSHTSGGMYPGVPPIIVPVLKFEARPKSMTTTFGDDQFSRPEIMMFASFKSQCITCLECK
mmetsp:Transcript_76536/g.212574  ORF Transcript_76536/g.212574 Transcript_76536/m.212574 type:complete len:203 (+) Transcript_76536:596-1204(+)